MRGKIVMLLCGLFVGVVGTILLMSGPLAVVKAECPGPAGTPCGNGDVNGNGTINMSDPIYLLQYLFAQGPPLKPMQCAGGLPATGQIDCYDEDGDAISCADPAYPGQDAFYQAGCPTEGRFVANAGGTVTDTCTGLMWQQATAPGIYTWQEALQYCEDLELGGHDDWRLPNVRELLSIVDYGRWDPAIDPVFSAESSWYWSSSSLVLSSHYAWNVHFRFGYVSSDNKASSHYVRAVRG